MPDYEQSATIEAPVEVVFDYLADVRHLPEYFPHMRRVEPEPDEAVTVETDLGGDGGSHEEEGWFHVDATERRIEWGAEHASYHGWMQVDPAHEGAALVTIHLHQEHETDTPTDLERTLERLGELVPEKAADG